MLPDLPAGSSVILPPMGSWTAPESEVLGPHYFVHTMRITPAAGPGAVGWHTAATASEFIRHYLLIY